MTLKEYADASMWFWPAVYVGVGFAQAGVIVLVAYLVHAIRQRIAAQTMRNAAGEVVIALLSLPAFVSVFAMASFMRLTHGTDFPASSALAVVVLVVALLGAYRLRPQGEGGAPKSR
jgi:hypothetical protein